MNDILTYSVLQYKHSLALGEILNVGILFYSSKQAKFKLVLTDEARAKAIYTDFNAKLYRAYSKIIEVQVSKHINLFSGSPSTTDFASYVNKNILAVDAAGLVFSTPVAVPNLFNTFEEATSEFAKLLLPGIELEKPVHTVRHDDRYIVQKFKSLIKDNEDKFQHDVEFSTKHTKLKFDFFLSHKDSNSYIRPVSFDLANELEIQSKAATYYGYLADLTSYSDANSFDLLISKPQNDSLRKQFENSLDYLNSVSKKNKNLVIIDEGIESYTASLLS